MNEVIMPVWLRVGDIPECHVGDIMASSISELRNELSMLLREAADVCEKAPE